MPKSNEPDADLVYEIAERFKEGPLREGTSLFTDRDDVWRGEPVEEVYARLIDCVPDPSDPFETTIESRLDGAGDKAVLLTAELVYIHLLVAPPATIDGGTKHRLVEAVLSQIEDPPGIPDLLDMALDTGLAPIGDAFNELRYWMVRYLAEFARKWTRCDQQVRESLLSQAWAFREFAFRLDTQKAQTQRHALAHMLFPATFEPIVSESAKQTIAATFSQFVGDSSSNVDQKLIEIRAGLTRKLGDEFSSFYDDTIRWQWQSDKWEALLEFAGLLYEWKEFDQLERSDRLETASTLGEVRGAFQADDPGWRAKLEAAFEPATDVVDRELAEDLFEWLDEHPEPAESALETLWASDGSAYERLGGFFQLIPDAVGTGPNTRLTLASFLLSGVEAGTYPHYKHSRFRDVLQLVDYPEPNYGNPVEVYRHALGFLDTLIEDLAGRGVVCRDRLDAQSLTWVITRTHPSDLDFLDPGVRREFAAFVGRAPTRRRNVWIFQAPPDPDDLEAQLAEAVDSETIYWPVTDYEDAITRGDLVVVWRAGDGAGALMAGVITDEPQPREEAGTFLSSEDDYGVRFRPEGMLEAPLTRETLRDDPVLRETRIATAPRGTNVPVDRRDWRRILAYRPDLADHLPVDQSADDVALAPFFRRFFNDRREADRFYGVLEKLAAKMGARGRNDRRFTMRIEGQSGRRLCLYYAERKMVAIRRADYEGARILLTLDAGGADDLGLESVTDWSDESDDYNTKFYEVPVQKARNQSDQLGRAFDRGMEATLRDYSEWSQSPYRPKSRHLEQAFAAIFDRTYRRRLFLEGIAEPEAVEPLTADELADDLFISASRVRNLIELVERRKNVILQGPPGVGKTLVADRLARGLTGQRTDDRIERVQLHPSYTYADLVQGYRRTTDGSTARRDGLFYQFCRRAEHDPGHTYVFIIDEIHRGDPSELFGELTTLLAPDRRGPDEAVLLQHSASDQETFHVPDNVHLIATLNTADDGPGLDDYAFRRRFAFVDLEPAYGCDSFTAHLRDHGVSDELAERINERMTSINAAIADRFDLLGPGYRIGHSYFCPRSAETTCDETWYRRIVRHEIAPLLREYWSEAPEEAGRLVEQLVEELPN